MEMSENDIFLRLKKVFFLEKETLLSQFGERFFSVLGIANHLWRNERAIRVSIRKVKRICDITGSENKSVIELGCGLGVDAIILALLGARKVTALDYSEDNIRMINNMVKIIDDPVVFEKLILVSGDACNTGLEYGKYEVIQIIDMISHCQDLYKLVSEIRRVAKPGCIVYVLDGNNGLKLREKKNILRIQNIAENGPLEEAHKHGKCIGIKSTYISTRKEIIKNYNDSLDNDTLEKLAQKTSGLYDKQIISFVDNFLEGKDANINRISFPDVCVVNPFYRNPINGMWPEVAFHPFKLKKFMTDNGIPTRMLPYKHDVMSGGFTGFLKRCIAGLIKYTYPASIFFAPGFELLGQVVKKDN